LYGGFINQEKIGKFIAERRKYKKLTQFDLAEKLGVSNRTISKWENGNSLPDYSMFNDLCKELDISINELLSAEKLTEENYQKKLEENFVNTIDYNNKVRNGKIKSFIMFIMILFFIYLLYKIFIVYFYYKDYSKYNDKEFPNNKNIATIQIHNNFKSNSIVMNELNIYIPDGFELITDKTKSLYVKDNCEPYIKGLKDKDVFDAMILVCDRSFDNIDNLNHYGINDTLFPWMDVHLLLKKYEIHDIIDMVQFYERHNGFKQNIFTNSNDIKINYIVRKYVQTAFPSYDYFYYLENDLRGYSIESMLDNKYYLQTILSYNEGTFTENTYGISFYNGNEIYFNHENGFEIINSISKK